MVHLKNSQCAYNGLIKSKARFRRRSFHDDDDDDDNFIHVSIIKYQ